jgi:hypothetical protein
MKIIVKIFRFILYIAFATVEVVLEVLLDVSRSLKTAFQKK